MCVCVLRTAAGAPYTVTNEYTRRDTRLHVTCARSMKHKRCATMWRRTMVWVRQMKLTSRSDSSSAHRWTYLCVYTKNETISARFDGKEEKEEEETYFRFYFIHVEIADERYGNKWKQKADWKRNWRMERWATPTPSFISKCNAFEMVEFERRYRWISFRIPDASNASASIDILSVTVAS